MDSEMGCLQWDPESCGNLMFICILCCFTGNSFICSMKIKLLNELGCTVYSVHCIIAVFHVHSTICYKLR